MQNCEKLFQSTQTQGEISQLRDEIQRLLQEIAASQQMNADLQKANADLQKEVAALKEKLNTNSNNSSLPPALDPKRPKRPRRGSGRKSGGQPGHRGHSRKLFSPEQVQENVDLYPQTCMSILEGLFERKMATWLKLVASKIMFIY